MTNNVVRILSSIEAEKELPIPCLLILMGIAQPIFTDRDRSKPSSVVMISRVKGKQIPIGIPVTLPYSIDWKQWNRAVIPIIEDERWRPDNPVMIGLDTTEYLSLLGSAIRQSFIDEGWGI